MSQGHENDLTEADGNCKLLLAEGGHGASQTPEIHSLHLGGWHQIVVKKNCAHAALVNSRFGSSTNLEVGIKGTREGGCQQQLPEGN